MIKKLISMVLVITLLIVSSVQICLAAGKTANGYKNNSYSGTTSDAKSFVNGIKSYDSAYTVVSKEPSEVSNADFYSKSHYIKYWASHGDYYGTLWGTANNINVDIFNDYSTFSWAGSNLEFVFLSACHQLDGLGSNPRAKYANAMLGNSAVRAICGYHEGAPASIDKNIADKFIEYAKTGESVKSSWILANTYYYNQGYSTSDYCVLTHSGNVQYSRFEGFPGSTYTRPGSSSTTILRFTSVYPDGTTQSTTGSLLSATQNIEGLSITNEASLASSIVVPQYSLVAKPININVKEDAKVMVFRDNNIVSTVKGEIGDVIVSFDSSEAIKRSTKWLDNTFEGISSSKTNMMPVQVAPILMAEVNLNGGTEIEQPVAYTVTYNNSYNGIRVLGSYYSVVMDNDGVDYSSINWADYEQIDSTNETKKASIGFDNAIKIVSDKVVSSNQLTDESNMDNNNSKTVRNVELVFDYNNITGNYQPTWIFSMDNDTIYKVNCFNGNIDTVE